MAVAVKVILVMAAGLWVASAPAAGAPSAPARDAAAEAPRAAPSDAPKTSDTSDAPDVYRHLKPLLVEPDDLRPFTGAKPAPQPSGTAQADRPPAIAVDVAARTVRIPVRPTRARGVVEWLLAASGKHKALAVLVTDGSARDVADAFAKAGFDGGEHPAPVGDDAARGPAGPAVRLALVARSADGREVRIPAERLLAATSDGKPLAEGRWVYAGPATLDDGKVFLSGLSGSVATTNLRDTSAMIYWVPAQAEADGIHYVKAFYARPGAVPAEASEWVLEIRPAEPSPAAKPGA